MVPGGTARLRYGSSSVLRVRLVARRASQAADGFDDLEIALDAQSKLGKPPCGGQHLLLQRSDRLVERIDARAQRFSQLAQVLAENREALVQVLPQPPYLRRVVRQHRLFPAVRDRLQQSDEARGCREHDVLAQRFFDEVMVLLQRRGQ